MASQLDSLSEEISSSQTEIAKATTGDTAKSDGVTSAPISVPQGTTAGGTQQQESSSSATAHPDSLLPLNGSVLSSSTATGSASVFDIILSSESAAHLRVCFNSAGLDATGATNDTEHKPDLQQVQETHDDEKAEGEVSASLETTAVESTLLDMTADTQQDSLDAPTQVVDGEQSEFGEGTQIDQDFDFASHDHATDEAAHLEHLPEPPASPISNTLLSTPSNSACDDNGNGTKAEPKARVPSANRISISYAGGNRRLVIDAEVVQSMKVSRHAGIIEVVMDLNKLNENEVKGILVSLVLFL